MALHLTHSMLENLGNNFGKSGNQSLKMSEICWERQRHVQKKLSNLCVCVLGKIWKDEFLEMVASRNGATPKSSILMGFSPYILGVPRYPHVLFMKFHEIPQLESFTVFFCDSLFSNHHPWGVGPPVHHFSSAGPHLNFTHIP